jgi:hypothetical protein
MAAVSSFEYATDVFLGWFLAGGESERRRPKNRNGLGGRRNQTTAVTGGVQWFCGNPLEWIAINSRDPKLYTKPSKLDQRLVVAIKYLYISS